MIHNNNRQKELLNTINQISMILLEPDMINLESKFMLTMNILGKVANVDRITIWRNHSIDDQLYSSLIYEWPVSPDSKNNNAATQNVPYKGIRWADILTAGECINSPVNELPQIEQRVLKIKSVRSIFIAPVFVDNEFWGYIGFDDCHRDRKFTENESIILHSAGRMLGSAYVRNEMTQNLLDAKAQLEKAKENAEHSSMSKSIFLSHMSHEIRTPMNAILGITEIQLQKENLNAEMNEAFEKIYESGDLLLNIINDILDLSKIESGKLEVIPVIYNLPGLINDTTQLNRMRYESKPIEFRLLLGENLPLELFGDELRIKQILNNILSNAFKYTDEGKIEFSVSVESDNSNQTAYENFKNVILIIRISDTGQGMTPEQIDKLYDEYTRFNLDVNRTVIGTGLGMNITKRLVDLMCGEIIIDSEPGRGSSFIVRIPQMRQGSEICDNDLLDKLCNFSFQNTSVIKKMQFLREYMPYGRVLVVDDVESNLFVAKGMLLPYGLKIETADSGFEAIEKIKADNVYDIIFMDHMMPRMDGIETVKIIREMGYSYPIVALTANALIGRARMFLQNGFDSFLSKPIDSRELNLILIDFIKNKQPADVIEAARRIPAAERALADIDGNKNKIKEYFIRDAENAIHTLENFTDAETEINSYITAVHGMKSALANIGEKELSETAAKLENAGRHLNIKFVKEKTPGFLNALKSLIPKLKPAETDNDDNFYSQENQILLREKIKIIKKACGEYDKKTAKNAMEELNKKKWPVNINNDLKKISVHLLHSEFSEIEEIMDNIQI